MTDTHAPTEAAGGFRARPYVGRYVPPLPPLSSSFAYTTAERISNRIKNAATARSTAHYLMRLGRHGEASEAFFRAHKYLEEARKIRDTQ